MVHGTKGDTCAPHIVSVAFVGVRSEVLLHTLEEKNIYVAYNYDTNTKTLTIITKTKVFAFEDNEYIEEWSEECIQYLKSLIGERTE